MKRIISLSALLMLLLALAACGAAPTAPEETPSSEEDTPTLEELCGTDYQSYIAKTITMQMGNRMDKTLTWSIFPLRKKPL